MMNLKLNGVDCDEIHARKNDDGTWRVIIKGKAATEHIINKYQIISEGAEYTSEIGRALINIDVLTDSSGELYNITV